MKLARDVSPEKLRGGFYSPDEMVDVCWANAFDLARGREGLRVLEPSVGDGAFVRGVVRHPASRVIGRFDAVELLPAEAAKARSALADIGVEGEVRVGSFLSPAHADLDGYDVAVGNPPFLRYQFVNDDDLFELAALEARIGRRLGRVSNLWVAIFLAALTRLRAGGVFSFILPTEFLTGVSASVVRWWLTVNASELQIDLFSAKSFPGALQEVMVLSGRVLPSGGSCQVVVRDHAARSEHIHVVRLEDKTWTGLTMSPADVDVLRAANSNAVVLPLGKVARIGVSTVTGANDFFTYDDATRDRYDLAAWSRPLVARLRHSPGLSLTQADWRLASDAGEKSWMLDTSMAAVAERSSGLGRYLKEADDAGIPLRYKTRIRSPWYRVPVVPSKALLLSKRSNRFPRMVDNAAQVVTTDTIYQGHMLTGYEAASRQLVASFHNSLTLLSAEVEGRSFGGGVLELVPSEVARLAIVDPRLLPDTLDATDTVARRDGYESDGLVNLTNRTLLAAVPSLDPDLLASAEVARQRLLARRLARN